MSFFRDVILLSSRFDRIKNSDRAAKSYSFGVRCILCCVFGALFALVSGWGWRMLHTTAEGSGAEALGESCGNIILGIPVLFAGALCALTCWLFALINMRYQLKMNKRAIGYVCIFLVIASVIGGVLGFVFLGQIL